MRHRRSGKKLNRNASHRRSMVRNMATSLILSASDNAEGSVLSGKIVTTIDKAKFLRPEIERLVTMAKKATVILENAPQVPSKDSPEWSSWRNSEQWQTWANTVAPAVSLRRRAFAILRSKEAVNVLFGTLAPRFLSRQGGYVRIVRLAEFRIGDGGRRAMIQFTDDAEIARR